MKIAIYSRNLNKNYIHFVEELIQMLIQRNIDVTLYSSLFNQLQTSDVELKNKLYTFKESSELSGVDYMMSIGGDGTLLESVSYVLENNIPILGINAGRLGFLTSLSNDDIETAVDCIVNKKIQLEKRILLDAKIENNPFGKFNYALNEVTIQKRDSSSMITIHTYLNGAFLNSYWADGLIISTPTGSTAYSLSCNGPIVLPNSGNIIITPIAPHNLNVRPLVISDDTEIKLIVESRADNYLVALDYKSATISNPKEILIKKSTKNIHLVRLLNYDFFNTLRNKLMWGIDKRN